MKNIYTHIFTKIAYLLSIILLLPFYLFAQTNISGIINTYYSVNLINGVNFCSNSLTLNDCSGLNVGDKVFIIQMKGASIDTSNTTLSGSVISYNGAGKYEMAIIDSINGCELIFRDSLVNNYNSSGYIQVINIPQYNDVTIVDTLKCLAWNGTTGGVLIFEASGTVTFNSPIYVSGNGFKGGVLFTCNANFIGTGPNYVMPSVGGDHVKGEGIATLPQTLLGGRGTVANGGGAGGAQPAQSGLTDAFYNGGGGGGNFGAGGNGGKSSNGINPQYPGGIGGRALIYSTVENRVFMGGGGGSGHRRYNTSGPTSGTNGAGIVLIRANTINGNNQNIIANGIDNLNILAM